MKYSAIFAKHEISAFRAENEKKQQRARINKWVPNTGGISVEEALQVSQFPPPVIVECAVAPSTCENCSIRGQLVPGPMLVDLISLMAFWLFKLCLTNRSSVTCLGP